MTRRRPLEPDRRFRLISLAGIFFQGGAAAVDPNTVVAALVHGLTGSPAAVGAAAGIVRFGWLFPQLFVAYHAQRRTRRLPIYMLGAFGRVGCLAVLAALLWSAGIATEPSPVVPFFVLWTLYSIVSGLVAVPYNDIVARSILPERRSRMLALRFFGGGLLALAVAAVVPRVLDALSFPAGYAALLLLGAALLLISATLFVTAGEPPTPDPARIAGGFLTFVRGAFEAMVDDRRFRLFLFAQWLSGTAAIALPFYVLQTQRSQADVGFLLAAQTAGALASNPLWGWWGDRRGKGDLLEIVAAAGVAAPLLALAWIVSDGRTSVSALPYFAVVFVLLGAVGNGSTIAYLGYLMEISPNDRRPAYSGYFNAFAAPAALLPWAGGVIAQSASYTAVFALSAAAAIVQFLMLRRLR